MQPAKVVAQQVRHTDGLRPENSGNRTIAVVNQHTTSAAPFRWPKTWRQRYAAFSARRTSLTSRLQQFRFRRSVAYQLNVLGARSLWSLTNRVRHFLAFTQVVEVRAFYSRTVKEHIVVAARRSDETEAFVRKPLNSTFLHIDLP